MSRKSSRKKFDFDYKLYSDTGEKVEKVRTVSKMTTPVDKLKIMSSNIMSDIDDFFETYNFLNYLDISYLHVFSYSERPDTKAFEMGKTVSKSKRAERSKMLHILSDKKRRYFHDQFIKKNRPVLFENMKNGKIVGHTDNYIKVQVEGGTNLVNTIQSVMMKENHTSLVSGVLN